MDITCDKSTPTEEGVYIWYPSLTLLPEMIRVVQYPSKDEFGVSWPSYLGVPTYNGAHVGKLQGKFSERLTFSMK